MDLSTLSSLFFGITYLLPLLAITEAVREDGPPSMRQMATSAAVGMFLIGGAMSCCLHRYFAHSAFLTSRAFQFVLAILSTFAYQGGPLWWASKHKRHHKLCDVPGDPHSPKTLGFWTAFLGWTIRPSERFADYEYIQHLCRYPELHVIDYIWFCFPFSLFIAARNFLGPMRAALWVAAPLLVCRLVTLLFNVEFHKEAKDGSPCKAMDVARFLGDLVGESAHSHHHKFPKALKRPSLGPPYVDVTYFLFIYPLLQTGLIWIKQEATQK